MKKFEPPMFLRTDSYKLSHPFQYPDANKMVAYGEFRKSYPGINDNRIVFYGIRYIIDRYLNRQWTLDDLFQAEKFCERHNAGLAPFALPTDLFESIISECNGYFPVKIEALPEGSVIYPHVLVYQITAEGKYSRLVTFLETLLTQCWYSTTVATLSRHTKTFIEDAFKKSVEPKDHWLIMSRLHDFGYRGCTSDEQAMIGGAAHLLNFDGTDTMNAAYYAHSLNNGEAFAQSIPATEHSVMTSWPSELEAVENMVEHFGHSLFACVADSYDYDNFLNTILPVVAPKVKSQGGTMVVRPDSGDPVECVLKGLRACDKHFGSIVNELGFKVLQNSAVIQGDGINIATVKDILDATLDAGYSAQNVGFGMGGGLIQKVNRDTLSFATKLSHIEYADGTKRDVMKLPKTDISKASMPGELKVVVKDNMPVVYPAETHTTEKNILEVVYDHGPISSNQETFFNIRERLSTQWNNSHATVSNDAVRSGALLNKMTKVASAIREENV